VPRNTPVPCIKKRTFTTVEDNQTVVTLPIYQGERVSCTENEQLGEFELHVPPTILLFLILEHSPYAETTSTTRRNL